MGFDSLSTFSWGKGCGPSCRMKTKVQQTRLDGKLFFDGDMNLLWLCHLVTRACCVWRVFLVFFFLSLGLECRYYGDRKQIYMLVGYSAMAKQILSILEENRLCACSFLAPSHLSDSLLSTLSGLFDSFSPLFSPFFLNSVSGTR